MGTFLTSPRMNPALAARVQRAVSHRVRAKHDATRLGFRPLAGRTAFPVARVLPLAALLLVVVLGVSGHLAARRALERERAAVLAVLASRRAALPVGHEGFLGATDRFLAEAASEAPLPDIVDPGSSLDALVHRPAVYVRAAASELRDPTKVDDVAGASIKDAFLWCLLTAPSTPETELLARVRGTYFGGAKLDEATANVRRLADARMGLEVLSARFEDVVRNARDLPTLARLRHVLDAAPIEPARKAAAAEVLIVVTDTVAASGGRDSRVTLVDLASKRVLFRVHPRADATRSAKGAHREQLEACALALAVRKAIP